MGVARSTFYDRPDAGADDAAVVAQMKAICDQFETYGYRRVGAELRHRGMVVNAKKVQRLMREDNLLAQRKTPFLKPPADRPSAFLIVPNLVRGLVPSAPDQIWVADITYGASCQNLRLSRRHPRRLLTQGGRLGFREHTRGLTGHRRAGDGS